MVDDNRLEVRWIKEVNLLGSSVAALWFLFSTPADLPCAGVGIGIRLCHKLPISLINSRILNCIQKAAPPIRAVGARVDTFK